VTRVAYTGTVEVKGLTEMVDKLQSLDRELRREANGMMRQGAKDIAIHVVNNRGQLFDVEGVRDQRIIEGIRPKYDRYVALQVPGVKPKLSGLKPIPAARAKSLAVAIEWGSSDPRLKNPPRGALVGRNIGRITRYVRGDYAQLVAAVLKRYGLI
jgi:hypothetical protein